jgi:hypothetical protein
MRAVVNGVAAIVVALSFSTSAYAQVLAPVGNPVTATGVLNKNLTAGTFKTVCDVTFYGTTDSAGTTFTSMITNSSSQAALPCEDYDFPIRVNISSHDSVVFKDLT